MEGRNLVDEEAVAGVVTALSVSHHDATLDTIAAASPMDTAVAMNELLDQAAVKECFILTTCNRAEWFVVTESHECGKSVLGEAIQSVPATPQWLTHEAALEHLLRVGAGLESMVLGEDQILGQLRDACADAESVGSLGPMLETAVWRAIRCGERVRTETAINEGVTSLGRAAVDLASRELALDEVTAMVVGAGEMGEHTAVAFDDAAVSELIIANRTVERAREVGTTFAGEYNAIGLDAITPHLPRTEVLVTATTSVDYVITSEALEGTGDTLVIDLGQPRDVDPQVDRLPNVRRIDLDDLEAVTAATRADRAAEARAAAAIVEEERENFQLQLKREQADHVLAAMYSSAEEVKERELANGMARLEAATDSELSTAEREVLEGLADAMVGQLLAAPTKSLREAAEDDDWETIQTALQLFNPSFQDGSVGIDTNSVITGSERATEDG